MSIVDKILARWQRDIIELERAAKAEAQAAANLSQQISVLETQITKANNEVARARTVISNLNNILATPTTDATQTTA